MRTHEFDIVVIGGGCIGASIAHELLRHGFRDLALVDHGRSALSATARSGGMLRVFHENTDHIELAIAHRRALDRYQAQGILTAPDDLNGHLYFFHRARMAQYEPALRLMKSSGQEFEILTGSQGRDRFPRIRWGEDECAIYEPRAGWMNPLSFTDDLLRESDQQGATIFEGIEIRKIRRDRERYWLSGNDVTLIAKTLILAGGARLLPQLRGLGLGLPLESRRLSVHLAKRATAMWSHPNFFDRETLEFGRLGRAPHVLLSNPSSRRFVDRVREELIEEISAEDCYAPGRVGLIGSVPGHPRLLLASGWGGTAFKFALEIGRRVANLVECESFESRRYHATT